jgi:hypothetical protein
MARLYAVESAIGAYQARGPMGRTVGLLLGLPAMWRRASPRERRRTSQCLFESVTALGARRPNGQLPLWCSGGG